MTSANNVRVCLYITSACAMPFQHTGVHSTPNYLDERLGTVSFCSALHIWLTFFSYAKKKKSWAMHVSCIYNDVVSNSDYLTSNDWMAMNNKRGRCVMKRSWPRWTEENTEKPVRLVGVLTKIWTETSRIQHRSVTACSNLPLSSHKNSPTIRPRPLSIPAWFSWNLVWKSCNWTPP
jgi:hypothetical protein